MKNTPVPSQIVKEKIKESGLNAVGNASIREIKKLVDTIEQASGVEFIRMEMGIPGLPPSKIGVDAQVEALR
ncbi:MAG: pyridoxal phosphate-dependent aminotransferase, partial [Bacteroidetes bacterium]|nr:pyridoxal phosphate-dependent aminotransferase [Bacteroidota bacterium]MBU1578058.1 pyridoxal phosphate-dependent aminotransferase [Bacteroidota bacterium]